MYPTKQNSSRTEYPANRQRLGLSGVMGSTKVAPRVLGPQDKTVVSSPLAFRPEIQSAVRDLPLHFREEDLLSDPLLLGAERTIYLEKARPTLGGIPLFATLGRGGMGTVYYAFHPRLRLEVAVKVLSSNMARQYPELVDRFQLEAQMAARVKSQHLVGVIDVNEDRGLHYLVMEYVHGVSADHVIKRHGELTEAQVLDICASACEGLAAAHAAGIVHRDVKPANVMIPNPHGQIEPRYKNAKIADLGIARLQDKVRGLTQADTPMGSPGFMAPEQIADSSKVTPASDVFGMGTTLYALLTRRSPFARPTYAASLLATVKEPAVPVKDLRPGISPATSKMIERCLAKNPQERYPDAAALLRELRICRASLNVSLPEQQVIAQRIERDARLSCVNAPAVVKTNRKMVVISVEDNEVEQLYIKHLFKKLPFDLELFQVNSPEDAMNLIQRVTPDIIFTDICMPTMDGYEFIETLRTRPELKLTPIVVKSAICAETGKQKSLHIGADAYLEKPIRFEAFESTIGRMISRVKK